MTRTIGGLLALLLLVSVPAGTARAQGFIIPELGSRVNGTGAAIGRPDELAAIYHNPGALALLPGTQVGLSFSAAILSVDLRLAAWKDQWRDSSKLISDPVDSEGYYPRQTPTVFAPVPFIGVSTNLWSEKLVGAFGIYVPNAAGADLGATATSRYHVIDAFIFSSFFTLAVAYRPWPWLAVGVGGSAVFIDVHRHALLYPVVCQGNPPQTCQDLTPILGKATELELSGTDVKPAFSLGIQAWPHRSLSLGFMMLTRYNVELEGELRLKPGPDAQGFLNNPAFTENAHVTEVVSPWIFGFGANWDITPWLEVGGEFRFYMNSLIDKQTTRITCPPGASEAECKAKVLPGFLPEGFLTPKNYHDSFHTGGGFVVRPFLGKLDGKLDLELMTGVHFDNSASPSNTFDASAPSFDLLAYKIGARWRIKDRYRISLFYAHYWYFERTAHDSITNPPTNFIGSAYTNMINLVLEGRVARGIGVP